MTGVLYFSSTGNSLYIAKKIAEKEESGIFYIPDYKGNGDEFDKIVIVSPIYFFGFPVHVYNLIPTLTKKKPVYFVLNYGGMVCGTDYFAYTYCRENGLDIKGVYTVKMVDNFTLTFTVPKMYEKSTLKSAPKRIEKVAQSIKNGEENIPKMKKTKGDIYLKNMSNWHEIADDFSTTENCILCSKCVDICPVDNILIENGKVTFSDKCVACLGCYHRCPQKAIVYKNKRKKDRYVNPFINEKEIGKDS